MRRIIFEILTKLGIVWAKYRKGVADQPLTDYQIGARWAKDMVDRGFTDDYILQYIVGSDDELDKGAMDALDYIKSIKEV